MGDVIEKYIRHFTGKPYYRAYLRNSETGKIIEACPHQHGKQQTAESCVKEMLRLHKISEYLKLKAAEREADFADIAKYSARSGFREMRRNV